MMTTARCGYFFLTGMAILTLGACAEQRAAVSAMTTQAAIAVGQGPKIVESKDFVKAQRPEHVEYMAVGVDAPARSLKPQSPDGVKAMEAQLEGRRTANESQGKGNEAIRARVLQNAPKPGQAPPPVKLSPAPKTPATPAPPTSAPATTTAPAPTTE